MFLKVQLVFESEVVFFQYEVEKLVDDFEKWPHWSMFVSQCFQSGLYSLSVRDIGV